MPPISISLPLIALVWCVAGCYVFGPVLLVYPALWLAVAALFWGLQIALPAPPQVDG